MDTILKIITAPYRAGRFIWNGLSNLINPGTRKCSGCGKRFASGPQLYQECPGCGAWVRKEKGNA